jgi:transposase
MKQNNLTKYEKSAIVGYYRSGAPLEQICWIVGLPYVTIERIINQFKKQNDANKNTH